MNITLALHVALFRPTNPILAKTAILGICWLTVIGYSRIVIAAEWSLESFIDMEIGVDDNPRLLPDPPDSVFTTRVTPVLRSTRNSETSEIDLALLLRHTAYRGAAFAGGTDREDTNDAILDLASKFQTSERTTWGLDAEFKRDHVFQSVDLPGTLPPDTDVGLVDSPVPRKAVRIRPSWARRLTERDTLRVDYRFRQTRYSNTSETDLDDFEAHALRTRFSRTIKPTYDLDITGSVGRFRNLDTGSETDNIEILAGITHDFSEITRGTLEAGLRETEETTATEKRPDSGYVFRARLRHRSELASFDGFIFHGLRPSGVGEPRQITQFRMRWRTGISRRLNFLLRTNIFRNDALEGGDTDANRRYAQIDSGLNWQLRRLWSINVSYRYRYQKFDNEPQSATSNRFLFGVTYGFNPRLL